MTLSVSKINLLCCSFILVFVQFFGGPHSVGPSFAFVAHFIFLRDVWIRTQGAAVASRCAANLATHLPSNQIQINVDISVYGLGLV
jgi:hypothetical protein